MGFRVSVSLPPAIQATGRLTLAPAGLIPAEHTSLRWTHKRSQLLRLALNDFLQADRAVATRAKARVQIPKKASSAPAAMRSATV